MKIGIISGSTRKKTPQSSKVAKFIATTEKQNGNEVYLLDLSETDIKFWDETFWSDYSNFDPVWKEASENLHTCDGFVVVAPEWNGMIPPALLNIFHLAVKGEFSNKPALIVTISSGGNGVYPVTQLRLNSSKNNFINYIPHHVIVRNVNNVLNDLTIIANDEDKWIRERLDYSLKILEVYTEGFMQIRNSEIIKNIPFANGM